MRRFRAASGSALFFAVAPGVVAGLVPWWLTGWRWRAAPGWFLPIRVLGAVLAAAGRAWMQVLSGDFEGSDVESAARGLQSIGLANDGSRLAGQAAIRTTDRKVMVALLGCARALQASGPGAATSVVDDGGDDVPDPQSTLRPAAAPMLSEREREVAELVLTGLTYRQIGQRLFISSKTVEHHVASLSVKTGVERRAQLVALAARSLIGGGPPST